MEKFFPIYADNNYFDDLKEDKNRKLLKYAKKI